MDAPRVRVHIEKFLAGKYVKHVDQFGLYQWLERCAYHGWVALGLNLLKFIHMESFDKGYQGRIQYLSTELHKRPLGNPERDREHKYVHRNRGKKRRVGEKTTQSVFRPMIVAALQERGGRARTREVASLVERMMEGRFTEADIETMTSGSTVWYNTMCWERESMMADGLLRKDSPHGFWELMEQE